jgi:hypothetical protein
MKAGIIVQRAAALESQRKTLDNTYQMIEKYVRPFSGEFFRPMSSENEVDWRRREIYDSTAIVSADLLAGQIHANLVSPAVKWFDFRYRDTSYSDDVEAQKWLDDLEEEVWQTLKDSDFDLQVAEFLSDIVTYGTGVMFEEEVDEQDWKGVDFTAIPIRDCYFEADAEDQPKRLYRRLQYTAYQLMDRFDMSAAFMKAHEEGGDIDRKYTVWFCVYPREKELKAYENADIKPKRLKPTVRPWGYKYVLAEGEDSISGDESLEEGGYYTMPAFRTVWKKVCGSKNGHSPAFIALSDILQLNETVKQSSEAGAKAIDPAMITTERGVIGDVDLEPGGLTVVTEMDQLEILESRARFDVQEQAIYRLQTSIRSVFFIDKLELKESPAMTATEVNVRYERMMRQFASTLGRLQNDFLDKLLHRTIHILMRHGKVTPAPDGIVGGDFDIAYTGPIPRAQQAEIANSIETLMADYAALGEIMPELLDLVDPDKMGLELARVRGVPTKIMRDPQDVAQIRAERAEMQAKSAAMAEAQQAGEAMKSFGEGANSLETAQQAQ